MCRWYTLSAAKRSFDILVQLNYKARHMLAKCVVNCRNSSFCYFTLRKELAKYCNDIVSVARQGQSLLFPIIAQLLSAVVGTSV